MHTELCCRSLYIPRKLFTAKPLPQCGLINYLTVAVSLSQKVTISLEVAQLNTPNGNVAVFISQPMDLLDMCFQAYPDLWFLFLKNMKKR